MHPTRTTRARARALAPLLLLALGATACGGEDTTPSASGTEDASPSASATPSETPTTATTSPTPTATPEATPSESPSASPTPSASPSATTAPSATAPPAPAPAASVLLSAAELPRLNDEAPWSVVRTRPVGSEAFGTCARFDALTIGAESGVERTFAHAEDDAAQQVLDFPDAKNATRAAAVVDSWRASCRSRVPGDNAQVRPRSSVAVPGGTGWFYLVSWEEDGVGRWESFGLAVVGPRVVLMKMDHAGEDHNYAPGRDPLERGLQRAAAKMG